jgi:hypothetical protein
MQELMSTAEAIALEVEKLTLQQQQSVLEYARSMTKPLPRGARLADLARFAGTISEQDLREIQEAIEEGCERVNSNGG